jgi:hypothetical protein
MGGEVEFELSSEQVGCAEARGVYSEYKEAVRSGEASGIGKASEVAGWSCEEFPLAEYPLIVRCRQGSEQFATGDEHAMIRRLAERQLTEAPAPSV